MTIDSCRSTFLRGIPKVFTRSSNEFATLSATSVVAAAVIDYKICQAWNTLKAGFERNNRNSTQYLYEWAERESNKRSIKAMP